MFALCACAPFSPQPALARSGLGVRSSSSLAYSTAPERCGCGARSRRSRHIVAAVDLHDPKVAALVAVAASQVVFNLLIFFNLDKVDEASGGRPDDDAPLSAREMMDTAGVEQSRRPWWQRPPKVWPPRVDEPLLVAGDVLVTYSVAYVCLSGLTTGRVDAWQIEGSSLASAWIVAAAVTNAWDPTAVLPSLGLSNALGCVARAAIDFASVRTFFALVGAVSAGQAVDIKLLALELVLGSIALGLWRGLYTTTNPDYR